MIRHIIFKRCMSKKSTVDILKNASEIPDYISPPAGDASLNNELDWSQLRPDMPASEADMTEQKDEIIFKNVISDVLSGSLKNNSARSSQKYNSPDSILALFQNEPSESKPVEIENAQSIFGSLLNESKNEPALEAIKKEREPIDAELADVYKHVEKLESNKEIIDFYKNEILPLYDGSVQRSSNFTAKIVRDKTMPYILEKCVSVLASDFQDAVGAIHLFEYTKKFSYDLFLVACTNTVYNEIIRIKWDVYRDLHAIVNLTEEMSVNAITPNLLTCNLLSDIYREASDSSMGRGTSKYGVPLWSNKDSALLVELNRTRTRFQSIWAGGISVKF